jgi:hypothetical protein
MRAFPVRLPSGVRYWTVLDEELAVVPVADSFLRQVRFGRGGAESTTRAYAGGIALFLRWCARSGRTWEAGTGQLPDAERVQVDAAVAVIRKHRAVSLGMPAMPAVPAGKALA